MRERGQRKKEKGRQRKTALPCPCFLGTGISRAAAAPRENVTSESEISEAPSGYCAFQGDC